MGRDVKKGGVLPDPEETITVEKRAFRRGGTDNSIKNLGEGERLFNL